MLTEDETRSAREVSAASLRHESPPTLISFNAMAESSHKFRIRSKELSTIHGNSRRKTERIGATGEGAARPHGCGIYGLPRCAGRNERRHRAGDQRSAQEGPGGGGEKGPARHVRRAWSAATFTRAEKLACWWKSIAKAISSRAPRIFSACATTWRCTSPRSIRVFCGARK